MNITISGNTATITTNITPEQIDKVAKLDPELLIIRDEETKRGIFTLTKGSTAGEISNSGAIFVPGVNGNLVIEVKFPAGTTAEKAKNAMFTYAAKAQAYIEEIEQRIADNIDALVAKEQEFLDGITIA